jgi:hypothetical protein
MYSIFLLLCSLTAQVAAQVSTTVVSVTSTTTVRNLTRDMYETEADAEQVHVTATDYQGACNDFVGACVVYGTYASAPYTTTVYRYAPSPPPPGPPPPPPSPPPTPSWTTSTTVVAATTTVSNSGACADFVGACVVYGTSANAPASSTVYYGSNGNPTRTVYYAGNSAAPAQQPAGDGQGWIGQKGGDSGDGFIGEASSRDRWTCLAVLGLAALCAVLMI